MTATATAITQHHATPSSKQASKQERKEAHTKTHTLMHCNCFRYRIYPTKILLQRNATSFLSINGGTITLSICVCVCYPFTHFFFCFLPSLLLSSLVFVSIAFPLFHVLLQSSHMNMCTYNQHFNSIISSVSISMCGTKIG